MPESSDAGNCHEKREIVLIMAFNDLGIELTMYGYVALTWQKFQNFKY